MAVCLLVLVLFLANAVLANPLDDGEAQQNQIAAINNSLAFPGKSVFDFQKYGWKIDVRVIPKANVSEVKDDDQFPDFPFKEIGSCILDFSFVCVQKRIAGYVDDVDQLDEFTLLGRTVKIVRAKRPVTSKASERRLIDESVSDRIDRGVDRFFETHALRITLPKWNGKLSQVNIMYDDTNLDEGRGKKAKGGKCKKMMMMMFGMMKMKLMGMMGLASMKGMMMAGMSLMLSKMMLIMKLMSLKKGGGFGGGGGGGSKEVVWVSKPSGGGCCNGGGGSSAPMDSYGAPPPTSYGAPSSGGGGYDYSGGGGGGGGWGRSFEKRPMIRDADYPDAEDLTESNEDDSMIADRTDYEPNDTWLVRRNLTGNWNNSAPLTPMVYYQKSNVGKEPNAFTNEGSLTKIDNVGKYNNDYATVNKYYTDSKKYNVGHYARIRSLLQRNASAEANLGNGQVRDNFYP